MKTSIKVALVSLVLSIGVHIYSTMNYYPLVLGTSTSQSLCNINARFNCDAVAVSSYSAFMGIPISLWGAMTNLALMIMLIIIAFNMTEKRESWLRMSYFLSLLIALTSVVMGGISTIALGTFCLTCIATYILSFTTLFAVKKAQEDSLLPHLAIDIQDMLKGKAWPTLIVFLLIPLLTITTHQSLFSTHSEYSPKKLEAIIKNSIQNWNGNPQVDFSIEPSLRKGPKESKVVVSEFADFLCPHCKVAATSLRAFAQGNKDVQVNFYSFPLDGVCNEGIHQEGNGVRCQLAKAVLCANKMDKGWPLHDAIFEAQAELFSKSPDGINFFIKDSLKDESKWDELKNCIESEDTLNQIKSQAKLGAEAGVQGTPTIYLNGKKLPGGQLLPILREAINQL